MASYDYMHPCKTITGGVNFMNEIHTKDIRATYISMIRKLQSYVDGDLSITHIRCTREPYANLYSYKIHKICNEFKIKYNSVMCNPDADIPTYIDVMARLEEANKSDCDGILFDTPFKQNQYIRNITSKVSSDKDMECFSDINYGKYKNYARSWISYNFR